MVPTQHAFFEMNVIFMANEYLRHATDSLPNDIKLVFSKHCAIKATADNEIIHLSLSVCGKKVMAIIRLSNSMILSDGSKEVKHFTENATTRPASPRICFLLWKYCNKYLNLIHSFPRIEVIKSQTVLIIIILFLSLCHCLSPLHLIFPLSFSSIFSINVPLIFLSPFYLYNLFVQASLSLLLCLAHLCPSHLCPSFRCPSILALSYFSDMLVALNKKIIVSLRSASQCLKS